MRENGSENLRGDHRGPVHQDQERKKSCATRNGWTCGMSSLFPPDRFADGLFPMAMN